MHETDADLKELQALLDTSHDRAGRHLRSIITAGRMLNARQLAAAMRGVQVLDLATVTADCRPLVAPVDGLFFRGRWYFGSGEESVRFRHLRARPDVSAAHTRGEELGVVVHGRAVEFSLADRPDFRELLIEVYGPGWSEWGHEQAPYAWIDADRMYTFTLHPERYPEA